MSEGGARLRSGKDARVADCRVGCCRLERSRLLPTAEGSQPWFLAPQGKKGGRYPPTPNLHSLNIRYGKSGVLPVHRAGVRSVNKATQPDSTPSRASQVVCGLDDVRVVSERKRLDYR